ncbi:carbohydrate ABC transporter permease [Ammoniphilus sp. CFH 90114]|uniref:carbohydrate ABC transporter permease n=1 Tax=Ammoniphilus sp. CFH 90114 TaxID=2493665 RepID=UPI00100E2D8E|nr:carbohydrate ABC transporter permease [Ammoniphilus sp. CFH 90114]RXT03752.1 carbohydrate ABC transporter permease [Ammoniphilus sp. CFH 90114]
MIFKGRWFLELLAIVIAILFLIPFYFILVNSVKSFGDIIMDGASWPKAFMWVNYVRVWETINFPRAFWNSLVVTVFSVAGMAIISAMAAYRIVRRPTVFSKVILFLFVSAMVIPFQSIMIPLVQVANGLNMLNSHVGLIFIYWGLGVPLSVFLFQGFIKTIPIELEEAAVIDGCSPYGVFWKVVFPLLKPVTVTVIILQSLWVWNDFLLPSLILQNTDLRTIPLANFSFFSEYTKQWDLGLAGLVMSITPLLIFFLFMQKHIIDGITGGSIKG